MPECVSVRLETVLVLVRYACIGVDRRTGRSRVFVSSVR